METFADYIAYPIKVNMDGEKVEIKDKTVFINNFDKIISEDMRNKFINQKVEEFIVNQYGISIGEGQFWLNQNNIYAINN